MFCSNCGNRLTDDSAVCPKCGTKLQASSAPSAANQTAADTGSQPTGSSHFTLPPELEKTLKNFQESASKNPKILSIIAAAIGLLACILPFVKISPISINVFQMTFGISMGLFSVPGDFFNIFFILFPLAVIVLRLVTNVSPQLSVRASLAMGAAMLCFIFFFLMGRQGIGTLGFGFYLYLLSALALIGISAWQLVKKIY